MADAPKSASTSAAPAPKAPAKVQQTLNVKIFSPYQIFYEGGAVSISAVSKTGPFDILLNHANFFSLLVACKVMINTGYQKFEFPINHGIIKVSNNRLILFVDV